MLMRRTTPLPIVENEMETTTHGHIAILADGSFAMTRAHGGPLVATFYDDLMEAINHVGARIAPPAASTSAAATPTAAELAAQRSALTPAEQALADKVATATVPVRGLTPGAPATRAAVPGSSPGIAATVPGSSPGIAVSTTAPAALTPAEQALAAHITATIQTP